MFCIDFICLPHILQGKNYHVQVFATLNSLCHPGACFSPPCHPGARGKHHNSAQVQITDACSVSPVRILWRLVRPSIATSTSIWGVSGLISFLKFNSIRFNLCWDGVVYMLVHINIIKTAFHNMRLGRFKVWELYKLGIPRAFRNY